MSIGKPFKIVGIIFGFILILLIAGFITLWIMFPPAKLKAMTLKEVEKAIGREVTVEKIRLSFYPVFGIRLNNLSVENTKRQGFHEEQFVTLEEFLLKIKVLPLFRKKLEIRAITLTKPTLFIELDKQGNFNFGDLSALQKKEIEAAPTKVEEKKAKGLPMLPVPLTLEEFRIVKGSLKYIDNKAERYITFGDVNQQIDFSIDKELKDISSTGKLTLSKVSVKTGEIPKPLKDVSLSLDHRIGADIVAGKAAIHSFRLSLQKISLNLKGELKNLHDNLEIDLAINSDKILIADIIREIPPELVPIVAKLKAQGYIQVDLNLQGGLDSTGIPDVKGKLFLGDGHIQYADLPRTISNIHANIHFTKDKLEISQFGFVFGENPVMLKALVWNFKHPNIDGALKASFNLNDIKDFVPLPSGMMLSGMVTSDIKAKGQADPTNPQQLDVAGTVSLKNVQVQTPDLSKPVQANGTVDFSSTVIKNQLSVKIGTSQIKLNSALTDYQSLLITDSTSKKPRPKLNFSVISSLLNVDELMKKQNQAASKQTKTPSSAKAKSESAPILAAPLPGIDLTGKITCNKFIYENIELSNFKTDINSLNDILKVVTKATIYKGTMSNNLHLNVQKINNVKVTNKFNVRNIDVNKFISNFNNLLSENEALFKEVKKMDNGLNGNLTLTTDISTQGRTSDDMIQALNGVINARIQNGKINGGPIIQGLGKAANGIIKIGGPVIKRVPGGKDILEFLNVGTLTFRDYKQNIIIRDQHVYFDRATINSSSVGDWEVQGNVAFNGNLDFNLANRLPRNISYEIVKYQEKGTKKAKSLIKQGTSKLGSMAGTVNSLIDSEIDQRSIATDRQGRATVLYTLQGTAGSPKITNVSFKKGSQSQTIAPKSEKKPIQEIKKVVTQKKQEIKKKVKKEVKKEVKKQTEDLKKKAKKKLKKLFN